MLFTDVIRRKRDGQALSEDDIRGFVAGLADDSLPPEQVSALAMAIYLNGMSFEEAGHLTAAMARSGTVLDWSDQGLDGPVVDKHSTGGVGDKVSFLLAPMAAACGAYVPMISGRGLGHTGGTLDKIGSIPGYDPAPDFDRFRKVVREVGCAIIGQTETLAPADRRLYAIRDITGTVESVPLITASILSKKMAAGLDALVMDVKVGSGSFMKTPEQADELARSLIETAQAAGLPTHALLTDMNEILGRTAGNALEIMESVQYLRQEHRDPVLDEVVLALVAEMLVLGGIEQERDKAVEQADDAVRSGKALEVFGRMVAALGGPTDFTDRYMEYLPHAHVELPLYAPEPGYLAEVDTFAVGNAIIVLGGGRRKVDDKLDLSVGLSDELPIGSEVSAEVPLVRIHARTVEDAEKVGQLLIKAYTIRDEAPPRRPIIYRRMP